MPKRSSRRLAAMSDDDEHNELDEEDSFDFGSMKGDGPLESANKSSSHTPSLEKSLHQRNILKSPMTPMQNLVVNMKQRLEAQLGDRKTPMCDSSQDKTSPGLAQLRNTPSVIKLPVIYEEGFLRQKQAVLSKKHKEAQDRIDSLNVGGGISIWPQAANMRLTAKETYVLASMSTVLTLLTAVLFTLIHGDLQDRLRTHQQRLAEFPSHHELVIDNANSSFKISVLNWHSAFSEHVENVKEGFDMSLTRAKPTYQLAVILYIFGILTLLYYLADNIAAPSKLTPRRIKTWVSLLVVMTTWTMKVLHLLVLAHRLEYEVENVIHSLSHQLSVLVYKDLDLTTYHDVLLHWRTCCLPPTTMGTLTVMGVVSIRDIMYYLQYYSLPVGTALLTPILKLIWSLIEVYGLQPT